MHKGKGKLESHVRLLNALGDDDGIDYYIGGVETREESGESLDDFDPDRVIHIMAYVKPR